MASVGSGGKDELIMRFAETAHEVVLRIAAAATEARAAAAAAQAAHSAASRARITADKVGESVANLLEVRLKITAAASSAARAGPRCSLPARAAFFFPRAFFSLPRVPRADTRR
jgi:hypothetical protein